MDLVADTPEQLEKYKDGSHHGKKKLEEVKKAEAERRLAEAEQRRGRGPREEMVPIRVEMLM